MTTSHCHGNSLNRTFNPINRRLDYRNSAACIKHLRHCEPTASISNITIPSNLPRPSLRVREERASIEKSTSETPSF